MQSTLKRGSYAPETIVLQALGSCFFDRLADLAGDVNRQGILTESHRVNQTSGIHRQAPMQLKELSIPHVGAFSEHFA